MTTDKTTARPSQYKLAWLYVEHWSVPLWRRSAAYDPDHRIVAEARQRSREWHIDAVRMPHSVIWVRDDVGPYAVIDTTAQPVDDDPLLAARAVTEEEAREILDMEFRAHMEHALGIERETATLLRASLATQRRLAELLVTPSRAKALTLAGDVAALERRAERELAAMEVADAMIKRAATTSDIDGHGDIAQAGKDVYHAVFERAAALAAWLDRTARADAELGIRQANPLTSLEAYEAANPGKLDKAHHARFRQALKTWLTLYIPRADFATLTHFGARGHHWTAVTLKLHQAALAAAVAKDAAADNEEGEGT